MTTTELLLRASDPRRHNPADYELRLAASRAEVQAAQRLRDRVFSTEGGARTPGPTGIDQDDFDDVCDHLIVWRRSVGGAPELPVATYRLLPPYANDADPRSAGLYADGEFDIAALEPILDQTVEAGRACVDPRHRSATPIALLWGGIARYMHLSGNRYLLGCASIPIADGGRNAAAFEETARRRYWAPPQFQCTPRRPFRAEHVTPRGRAAVPASMSPVMSPVIPALLRGYLRLGAVVCGSPALDLDFGSADFLILLDLQQTDPRYLRRFLEGGA